MVVEEHHLQLLSEFPKILSPVEQGNPMTMEQFTALKNALWQADWKEKMKK